MCKLQRPTPGKLPWLPVPHKSKARGTGKADTPPDGAGTKEDTHYSIPASPPGAGETEDHRTPDPRPRHGIHPEDAKPRRTDLRGNSQDTIHQPR
ncbi:hypothetical protein FKM82_008593 [Ascaphus truei]